MNALSDANMWVSLYCEHRYYVFRWKHPVIVLKDVKASLVESVLMLVYRGEVTVPADNLDELIKLARTLGIRGRALDFRVRAPQQLYDHVNVGLENVTIGLRDIEPAPSMSHGPSQSVEPVNEPVVMSPASSVPMPAWNRRKQQSSRVMLHNISSCWTRMSFLSTGLR